MNAFSVYQFHLKTHSKPTPSGSGESSLSKTNKTLNEPSLFLILKQHLLSFALLDYIGTLIRPKKVFFLTFFFFNLQFFFF
jgi:hypothetical protein